METAVETHLGGLVAPDGTHVLFDVQAQVRAGTTASGGTLGFHQIELKDVPPNTTIHFVSSIAPGAPTTGEFGAHESAGTCAQETLHLAGLP